MDAAEPSGDGLVGDGPAWSERIQTVLDVARPLESSRQDRLPLYLWPATNANDLDDETATHLVKELDRRGVGLISTWSPGKREQSVQRALVVAYASTLDRRLSKTAYELCPRRDLHAGPWR